MGSDRDFSYSASPDSNPSPIEFPSDTPARPGRIGVCMSRPKYGLADYDGASSSASPIEKEPELEYRHSQMNHNHDIRLLLVDKANNPTDPNVPIECSFIVTSLQDNKHKYKALSYCWGAKDTGQFVIIRSSNAQVKSNQDRWRCAARPNFYVRCNLYSALLNFRRSDAPVLLWVDALCINQRNEDEKSAQVARMDEIYSKATNVCIWLGPEHHTDADTFKFMKDILDLSKLDELIQTPDTKRQWVALSKLMTRKWFSRRWVIQELALAKKASIHCGSQSLNWVDFAVVIELFVAKYDSIKELFRQSTGFDDTETLGHIAAYGASQIVDLNSNLFRRTEKGELLERTTSLESLMATLLKFEASDPRDTVYALLSIAKEPRPFDYPGDISVDPQNGATTLKIKADYTKETVDVYTDFTAFCIQSSGSLDIICRPWAPIRERKRSTLAEEDPRAWNNQYPSWISRLSDAAYGAPGDELNGRKNGEIFVGNPGFRLYKASGSCQAHFRFGTLKEPNITEGPSDPMVRNRDQANAGSSVSPTPPQFKEGNYKEALPSIAEPVQENKVELTPPTSPSMSLPTRERSPQSAKFGGLSVKTNLSDRDAVKPSLQNGDHFSKSKVMKTIYDGTLHVKGFHIDTIKKVSPRVLEGVVQRECLEMGGWYGTNEARLRSLPEELWRTLIADRGPTGRDLLMRYRVACLECLAYNTTNGDIKTELLIERVKSPNVVEYLKLMQTAVWNRLFLRSENGRFGLGPNKAKEGDIICILLGCSVPVILRKNTGHEDDSYTHVGEAYVDRLMDGQGLKGKGMTYEEIDKNSDWFTLR